jgi:hypothetical protein
VLHALFVGTVQVTKCLQTAVSVVAPRPAGRRWQSARRCSKKAERRDHLDVAISFAADMNTPLEFTTGTN